MPVTAVVGVLILLIILAVSQLVVQLCIQTVLHKLMINRILALTFLICSIFHEQLY